MKKHDYEELAYTNGFIDGYSARAVDAKIEIDRLVKENEKLKVERDAAVSDLGRTTSACDFCTGRFCETNPLDSGGCKFEWYGIQKEKHGRMDKR